ncbi:IS66 family transposase [Terrimonas pollutisoli]|uniref:IS66 family transposase n=1 Tax=Terrimonas pollutisoli TaxID=3034147 RepID=UPI0023EDF4E5|nr:IS66 family transposase [Terrimonas sp. H1YJ31]
MSTGVDYKALYEQSQLRIIALEQQLTQLQKMIFGSRHERFIPAEPTHPQLSLGLAAEAVAAGTITSTKQISYTRHTVAEEPKPLVHPGRMKLPESLRREEILIEPANDTTGCKKIGEEITEVLEYQPGELYVKQYKRPKYAKPDNEGIVIGQLPSRPLEKAMAGEGLLAQIIIDKYIDHLPLHRQMQRFERAGVKLAYSTLTDWVSSTCKLIEPLFEALKAEVLQSTYLHADETPIKVMDKDKKGETHRGYYWVYQNSIDKIVLFDYQEGRGREGPVEILKDFKGYLQTDGYVAYDVFAKRQDITLIHCMAHARRMFNDALDNDETRSSYALQEIQKLYAIERICREKSLGFEEIKAVRQAQSVPVLAALGGWMKQQYVQILPKSAIGKALAYSIERWKRLSLYTEHGMLKIDNNPVENSIRPVALGRKNYLFAGSHEAAKRSGMLYSLLGTCKMHDIEPYTWLKDVLQRIADHPVNKVQQLLPHRYKK